MKDTTEQFDFSEEGVRYTKLCVDITVYWRGSVFDRADSVIGFYKRALAEVEDKLKFFRTGSMSRAKRLRSDSLEMIPRWFRDPKRRRDIYMMILEGGAHADEPSDYAVRVVADEDDDEPVGVAQLCLPVTYGSETPEQFLSLVKELSDGSDFESGHAGYSLNWNHLGDNAHEATEKIGLISRRYLGVDFFDHDVTMVAMRSTFPSGIKCINWLTLLGTSLTERVGGVAKLKSKLASKCEVHSLSSGVLLRAGGTPTTGNRNRITALTSYRSVGKMLAPFRFPDHRAIFGSTDVTSRWLARFDT